MAMTKMANTSEKRFEDYGALPRLAADCIAIILLPLMALVSLALRGLIGVGWVPVTYRQIKGAFCTVRLGVLHISDGTTFRRIRNQLILEPPKPGNSAEK